MKFFGKKNKSENNPDKELNEMLNKLKFDSEMELKKIEAFLNFINNAKKHNINILTMNLEDFIEYLHDLQEKINEKIEFSSKKANKNIPISNEIIQINKIISLIGNYMQKFKFNNLKQIKINDLINLTNQRKEYINELLNPKNE
ncbi:MAG: hypothetical protein N2Z85_02570 [Patescibacteria group bacterium]|nr:hypothetical protein [Patescibacteria group bacterium]